MVCLLRSLLNQVVIYTDGACKGNRALVAWGALLRSGALEKSCLAANWAPPTTAWAAEPIQALAALKTLPGGPVPDSQYVRQGITERIHGWKKRAGAPQLASR